MGSKRTWTEDDLRRAIANSISWRGVARELGLQCGGGSTFKKMKALAIELPIDTSHFKGAAWNKGNGVGRNRDLSRAAIRRHYATHREYYAERNARRRRERVEMVRKLKDAPCQDCGKRFPYYAMDFDHRPGTVKLFNISRTANGVGKARLLAEIAKCDLVCATCHRYRTAARLDPPSDAA